MLHGTVHFAWYDNYVVYNTWCYDTWYMIHGITVRGTGIWYLVLWYMTQSWLLVFCYIIYDTWYNNMTHGRTLWLIYILLSPSCSRPWRRATRRPLRVGRPVLVTPASCPRPRPPTQRVTSAPPRAPPSGTLWPSSSGQLTSLPIMPKIQRWVSRPASGSPDTVLYILAKLIIIYCVGCPHNPWLFWWNQSNLLYGMQ